MHGQSTVTTQVLSALLVLVMVAATVVSVVRGRHLRRRVESRPDGRLRLYRTSLLSKWPIVLLLPALAWAGTDLTAANLPLTAPRPPFPVTPPAIRAPCPDKPA